MHLRVLHRLSTPSMFNNVPCIKGNSILQNAGTKHVQRIKNEVNLQKQYFDCTKNKENAGNVYIKCLLYNVFQGSCAKRRHFSRTAYQKQSQFTKHSILTVQKTKKMQATYISNACFTMCFKVVVQNAGTKHVQRIRNKVNLQKQYFHCTKCKVYADNV